MPRHPYKTVFTVGVRVPVGELNDIFDYFFYGLGKYYRNSLRNKCARRLNRGTCNREIC